MERHVNKSIGTSTYLDEDDAREIIKDWIGTRRADRRYSIVDLAAALGTDLGSLNRMCDPEKSLLPSLAQVRQLLRFTGELAPTDLIEAIAHLGKNGRNAYRRVIPGSFSPVRLTRPKDLAAWLHDARRAFGTLISRNELALHLGVHHVKVKAWESAPYNSGPTARQVRAIAELCQVPAPTVDIDWAAHEPTSKSPRLRAHPIEIPQARTLAEEILWTGRVLSHIACAENVRERNARMFFARFVTHGKPSTQTALAKRFHMTNGRVSQIFDRQLAALGVAKLRSDCFDTLMTACQSPEELPAETRDWRIRVILGEGLTLEKAAGYGAVVFGKRLPVP
jgi:hypothetical protein